MKMYEESNEMKMKRIVIENRGNAAVIMVI